MSFRSDIAIHAGDLSDITESELGEALSKAINYAYSTLPDSILLAKTWPPINLYAGQTTANVDPYNVFSVIRLNSDRQIKPCIEVSQLMFDDYIDSNSVYFATEEDPVYTIKSVLLDAAQVQTLVVAPAVTGAFAGDANTAKAFYRFSITSSSAANYLDTGTIDHLESKTYPWIVLTAALFILGFKLREAILEEEDQELSQLMQTQMQLIKGQIDAETSRLMGEESVALDDKALQQIENPTKGRPTQR